MSLNTIVSWWYLILSIYVRAPVAFPLSLQFPERTARTSPRSSLPCTSSSWLRSIPPVVASPTRTDHLASTRPWNLGTSAVCASPSCSNFATVPCRHWKCCTFPSAARGRYQRRYAGSSALVLVRLWWYTLVSSGIASFPRFLSSGYQRG